MATRRTFEGTDLEALLGQVRSQLGEDARIISAEKTRSGGLGGFFVREQYVVVAESRRAERRQSAPASPAATPARIKVPSAVALGAARVPAPALPAPARRSAVPVAAPANTLDRLLAMADAVSEREMAATRAATPAPMRRVAAPTGTATAVSASVRAADAARRSSFDLLSSRTSSPSVSGAPRPAAPVDSVFARAERMGPVIDLTDSASRQAGVRPRMPRLDGDEIVVAHTATGKRLGRLKPAFADAPRLRRSDLTEVDRDDEGQVELDPPTWVAASPARRTRQRSAGAAVASRDALVDLGVPSELIALADVTSDELAEMLEDLPAGTAPVMPGEITVFIGELAAARALAASTGAETVIAAPTTPEGVSAWLVLRDPEGARHRRAKWLGRAMPTVVAIDGSPLGSDPEWVMAMIDAVMPDRLHLVVDAQWPIHELGDWVSGLTSVVGEESVVIDLVGADRAERPAAVLGLGLPVETLDGRSADGRTWADLLVSHLLANRMGA